MEIAQLYGLSAVVLTITAISSVLYKVEIDRSKSISQHVATHRVMVVLFGLASTISGTLLYLYAHLWFVPRLGLPVTFEVLFAAAIIMQVIAAWIPDYGDTRKSSHVHQLLAFSMAGAMPMLLLFLVAGGTITIAATWVITMACAAMAIYVLLFLFIARLRKQFLIHQSIYIALFYVGILTAALSIA